MVMFPLPCSAQAEEGQDGQDHNDEANKVDDAIHFSTPLVRFVCASQKSDRGFWLRPAHKIWAGNQIGRASFASIRGRAAL
jgi:hypothetical protein